MNEDQVLFKKDPMLDYTKNILFGIHPKGHVTIHLSKWEKQKK